MATLKKAQKGKTIKPDYSNIKGKGWDSYTFRLVPSLPKYNNMLLEEILKFHNLFQIKLDLSKSIKASATISFQISLNN